jgi:hypothetical protein
MKSRVVICSTLLLATLNHAALGWPALQSTSPYSIKGKVRDLSGQPLSGVTVCAHPQGAPGASSICERSDSDGGFRIFLKRPGRYALTGSTNSHVPQLLPFFRDPVSPLVELTLSEPGANAFASLTLGRKNGVLVGRAVDATTGLPIDDFRFVQCHADNPEICNSLSAKSGDGMFRIVAPHVPFTLKITATGYEEWFGLSGDDRRESIHIRSGETTELAVSLKRRQDSADKPLHEAEKTVGVNLQSPIQLSPEAGARFNHFPRHTKLEWAPVEGAVAYTVEVDMCQWDEKYPTACANPQPMICQVNPITMGAAATTHEFSFVRAQPGRWRVWARDKEGREGFKSPWREFVYFK